MTDRFLHRDDQDLHCYASGDGALHFTWVHTCKGEEGQSSCRTVTESDVEEYLKHESAHHLVERHWRPVFLNGFWNLVSDVTRYTEDLLRVEGKLYRYEFNADVEGLDPQQISHHLTVYTTEDSEEFEVKHISTRQQMAHFLAHEDKLSKVTT